MIFRKISVILTMAASVIFADSPSSFGQVVLSPPAGGLSVPFSYEKKVNPFFVKPGAGIDQQSQSNTVDRSASVDDTNSQDNPNPADSEDVYNPPLPSNNLTPFPGDSLPRGESLGAAPANDAAEGAKPSLKTVAPKEPDHGELGAAISAIKSTIGEEINEAVILDVEIFEKTVVQSLKIEGSSWFISLSNYYERNLELMCKSHVGGILLKNNIRWLRKFFDDKRNFRNSVEANIQSCDEFIN